MRLISGLILISFMIGTHRPNNGQKLEPDSALQGETKNEQVFPVVYGKKHDGFPDRVNLRGAITKVSFSQSCGLVHAAGVLQIKVARTAPPYSGENIYVVAPCLRSGREERYLGKVVCVFA